MEAFIVDAFTDKNFCGNQAGVVLLAEEESIPADEYMQYVAAELRFSETVFVKEIETGIFHMRYFTPTGEIDLCGHATISAFTVLHKEKSLPEGNYNAVTKAGILLITVENSKIWMDMTEGQEKHRFTKEEAQEFYRAYGLDLTDCPMELSPCIVSTGLDDVLLPVENIKILNRALQNRDEIIKLSQKYQVIGVHMFTMKEESNGSIEVHCRNFAPVCGIDEEAATGTSNGALTYYLWKNGFYMQNEVNHLIQGEVMGKPSDIYSFIDKDGKIRIGGNAMITMKGHLTAPYII